MQGVGEVPVTPERASRPAEGEEDIVTPMEVERPCTSSVAAAQAEPANAVKQEEPETQNGTQAKRRRLQSKTPDPSFRSPAEPLEADPKLPEVPAPGPTWLVTARYVPLEVFWWRRVVCDEFHELLGRYPPA